MNRKFRAIGSAIAFVLLTACTASAARNVARSDDTLDFTLKDLRGRKTSLSSFRGHPVVVDFWATWCGPCRKQIPQLKKLNAKYESQGLVVLGVACDTVQGDGVEAVVPFVRRYEIDYPILLANERLLDTFNVEAIPTTVFISADGREVGRLTGFGTMAELEQTIRQLMQKGRGGKKVPKEPAGKVYEIGYKIK